MKINGNNCTIIGVQAYIGCFLLGCVLLVLSSCAYRNVSMPDESALQAPKTTPTTFIVPSEDQEILHESSQVGSNSVVATESSSAEQAKKCIVLKETPVELDSVSLPSSMSNLNPVNSDISNLAPQSCNCAPAEQFQLGCSVKIAWAKFESIKKIEQLRILLDEANAALEIRDEFDAIADLITKFPPDSFGSKTSKVTDLGEVESSPHAEIADSGQYLNDSVLAAEFVDDTALLDSQDFQGSRIVNTTERMTPASGILWYLQAAKQGDVDAQMILGNMYYHGNGVLQDYTIAEEWYRMAADQGDAVAQYTVAQMHHEGRGVKRDDGVAAYWFRKAAARGNSFSMFSLALLYNNGQGVEQSDRESMLWLEKSVQKTDAASQSSLSLKFYLGEDVPRDLVKAYVWIKVAAEVKSEFSKARDLIFEDLTISQREQAQEMSALLYK